MEGFWKVIELIVSHYQEVITAIVGILTGIIAISLLIPGDQPEKALQSFVNFISKFSNKPKGSE